MGLSRNALAEPAVIKEKDKAMSLRIEQLARRHKHWGVLKIYRRLRKQGELVNHKRVRRLYGKLGLNLRRRTKKRLPDAVCKPLPKATACNQCWSLDFTSDTLTGGRKFRTARPPARPEYSRRLQWHRPLGLWSGKILRFGSFPKEIQSGLPFGKPERLRSDNGPEFIRQVLRDWCKDEAIELCWIEPGKPTQNAYIERFKGTFRREVLDAHIFISIRQVRQTVDVIWS
ncbi:transposase [Spirosoma aureum]|uniref:Transposase n=1 Tax=Spirosoma aureum TaxID=2692134 RepID=A0A6G9ALB6_9BACT|nr:integrase core domain-containing protein [Spirosoma aureum]QIP13075.1 transposase [Spirosoma aureum]